uniref:Uncharacterized protein n=1 Tax=Pseudochlorodesmis sp. HV01306c TaxID=2358490 RepID=A0A386AYG7_9CHLO|nr:hypothetical protein [Pseudochlorodesmis sp. HV01306c]
MGKSLIIFHDLGEKVSAAFINILRNLVSSGESQNVSRKFETTATIQFDGLIAAASNKNPFSHQQREGLADRRMIYVPFVNRVPPAQIQSFETMFPTDELQALTAFAVQQDPNLILQFIRTINQDAFVRQGLLDSYKENRRSLYLQNFIRDKVTYAPDEWIIFGSTDDDETGETLYSAYLRYTKEKGANFIDILSFNPFRQEFLPLLNSLYGFWEVYERRRLHDNKRKIGLLNLGISQKPKKFVGEHSIDLSPYRAAPFWLHGDQQQATASNSKQQQATASNRTTGDQQRPLVRKTLPYYCNKLINNNSL